MRRIICVICVLLCLPVLAAAAPEQTGQPAPAEAASVAFPMGAAPGWPVEATSVLVIDRDSGQSLYESDADARTYPASTTKIMTALCVAEAVEDLDGTEVTVRESVLGQLPDDTISLAGLEKGETLTVRQLLYCLLLPSGNDAAVVLGDYVGGSLDAFVERMNAKAAELGCTGTHFASVNGLSGREHYTTARDMARIAEALLRVPDLAEIVATPVYSLTTNVHKGLRLENTNHLIDSSDEYYMPSVNGVKTGSSTLSGRCLIASAEQDGMRLLCVIMGAPYMNEIGQVIEPSPAMVAAHDLYTWAFSAFRKVTLSNGVTPLAVNIEGVGATTAHPDGVLTAVLPADQAGTVTQSVYISSELRTPLRKGQTVGEVVYMAGGMELARLPLILEEDLSPMRWWYWPLPIAAVLAVAAILLKRVDRRRSKKARARAGAPARPAARPAARSAARPATRPASRPASRPDARSAARTATRPTAPARTASRSGERPAQRPRQTVPDRSRRPEESDFSPFVDYDDRPRGRR